MAEELEEARRNPNRPRGHVRVVYLGPVAPHWEVQSTYGDAVASSTPSVTGPSPASPCFPRTTPSSGATASVSSATPSASTSSSSGTSASPRKRHRASEPPPRLRPLPAGGRSSGSVRLIRSSHSPGASTSAGVGRVCGPDHSRARPSSPARSNTPRTKSAPRSTWAGPRSSPSRARRPGPASPGRPAGAATPRRAPPVPRAAGRRPGRGRARRSRAAPPPRPSVRPPTRWRSGDGLARRARLGITEQALQGLGSGSGRGPGAGPTRPAVSPAMPCTTSHQQLPHALGHVRAGTARRATVISRRHTHSRTSSRARLQSSANRADVGGHHQQAAARAGGWAARTGRGSTGPGARRPSPAAWRPASAPWSPSSAPAGRPAPVRCRRSRVESPRSRSRRRGPMQSEARSAPCRRPEGAVVGPCGVSGPVSPGAVGAPSVRRRRAGDGRAIASSRKRQSSTVRQAHAPGPTATISTARPGRGHGQAGELGHVELGDPGQLLEPDPVGGIDVAFGLAAAWPPPGPACGPGRCGHRRATAPHELEEVAEDLLQEVAARARAGNATPGIVGGAPASSGCRPRRQPGGRVTGRAWWVRQPLGESASVTVTTSSWPPRARAAARRCPAATV